MTMTLQTIRTRAATLAVLCALSAALPSAQTTKVDVSGTWVFEVQTPAGGGSPTVTLKQDGEKLTGHYSSATLGEADLTGSVSGNTIAFDFTADVQGNSVPVSYKGTVENNTSMKGTISITGVGDGTFTGAKK
jgi:hypothetical protein